MITDPSPTSRPLYTRRLGCFSFARAFWLAWGLALLSTAVWVAWPALHNLSPPDVTRLVITSALAGVAGLLLLTVIEIRLAPWRFLDELSPRVPCQGGRGDESA